jgi:hypothetical protein
MAVIPTQTELTEKWGLNHLTLPVYVENTLPGFVFQRVRNNAKCDSTFVTSVCMTVRAEQHSYRLDCHVCMIFECFSKIRPENSRFTEILAG